MLTIIKTIVFLSYGLFLSYAFKLSITDYKFWIMVLLGGAICAIGYLEGRKEEK